ncbi:tRNA (adenosine(37)-N6)-dimethylallyltransferase MiaA [Rathayibacter sp. YIM 133350]|uniref:tRNA (adenosine(37)-N6)-dimethylallyltransferase MiaA n=1 Tax=Rathayibacter sp. YIM 133350 TaxID=3131992 RepID=UPI00307F3A2B
MTTSTEPGAPIVAVIGATGTGKSELALDLAESLIASGRPAEIVNADAMQLYAGMDVGTAKLPLDDRRGIPHHLFDVWPVTQEASVARYQQQARAVIERLQQAGVTPILVGGSGLYVSAAVYDFRFPGADAVLRQRLEADLAAEGIGALHRRLRAIDPTAAERIGPHNARRIVRALEIIEITGEPHAASLPDQPVPWRPLVLLGLSSPRAELVDRLDERVLRMWRTGMITEVESLIPAGIERGVTASKAIGYAQALRQIRGEQTQAEAIAETQALTRRYARRQVSWFKRYPGVEWMDAGDAGMLDRARAAIG